MEDIVSPPLITQLNAWTNDNHSGVEDDSFFGAVNAVHSYFGLDDFARAIWNAP